MTRLYHRTARTVQRLLLFGPSGRLMGKDRPGHPERSAATLPRAKYRSHHGNLRYVNSLRLGSAEPPPSMREAKDRFAAKRLPLGGSWRAAPEGVITGSHRKREKSNTVRPRPAPRENKPRPACAGRGVIDRKEFSSYRLFPACPYDVMPRAAARRAWPAHRQPLPRPRCVRRPRSRPRRCRPGGSRRGRRR